MIKFIIQYKDLFNIFFGVTAGVILSIVSFLVTHRFNWRNFFTKEFTVKLTEDFSMKINQKITRVGLVFELNCTNSDEFSINYIFLKFSEKVIGKTPPNPTVGEFMFSNKVKLYIQNTPVKFKHFVNGKYDITDERILEEISKKNIRKIILVVNSNKYGSVKSNSVRINKL